MNIYGASGHGKVVFDILKSRNIQIDAVFDDNQEIQKFLSFKVTHKPNEDQLKIPSVLAIGNNVIRKQVARRFTGMISEAVSHASAIISDNIKMAAGTVVMPGAIINAGSKIGKHCIINSGAVVEHDVQLQDFVHIAPNAVVTGNVTIAEGTQVGTGASVIPGVKIGKWVSIGAGAVIIEDVPDFAVVVGNPGKIIKYLNE
ncbi:sugar O-acyltransferase, sialic acid O-acetyltransferase NeuD family [Salegentibacter holothuriorum]|uniref:Sugar O-acyltransferase, sialic acid O-acetyltransferase NeuD family n=1 Tax=Salegentibacter holothuriorum TaxID=241145 RepID=A0A1T5ANM3_9FLAO|nr:acetyltransferase [Salegentibacter holothuriorum]SKB36614.1 sugar O-acyltransferase, sialic acid O-acetyltransferase NeuD family [Salegentibacter holothuriorum]